MSADVIDEITSKLESLRQAADENDIVPGEWLTSQLDEILNLFPE